MADNNFKGTLNLLRFYLRRDRFILPVWILLPLFLISGQISFIESMADWREFMAEHLLMTGFQKTKQENQDSRQ